MMSDASGTTTASSTRTRSGTALAIASAASAAVLSFLPILILGFAVSVIAMVLGGEVVAWVSSIAMTLTILGIPAVIGLLLLFIPYLLFRAAESRVGHQTAIRWVGGLLVAWNAAIAVLWVREALVASAGRATRPEVWYAVAFGIAALVILIATVALDRQKPGAARAVLAAFAGATAVLVSMLVAVWGSPPRISIDAQTVRIMVDDGELRLDPSTVRAGDVYFVTDGAPDSREQAELGFVSAGYAHCPPCEVSLPMSDEAVAGVAQGDYQGTSIEGGFARYAKFALLEGTYALVISGADSPGIPPDSIAVLEVTP